MVTYYKKIYIFVHNIYIKIMNKVKHRLIQACYIFILIIAIVLFLLTYIIENQSLNSYLLSLSSSCIGTVFFFLIFKFFLADSDTILLEKIDILISEKFLSKRATFSEKEAMGIFFSSIDGCKMSKIYLIGYSMAHIFQQYQSEFVKYINEKTEIKILLIDPNSTAGSLMAETIGNVDLVQEPHFRSIKYINKINSMGCNTKYNMKVKKINWVPSCNVIYAMHKDRSYSMCLGINGFVLDDNIERRLYSIEKSKYKDKYIAFIESHFESLWNKGIEV